MRWLDYFAHEKNAHYWITPNLTRTSESSQGICADHSRQRNATKKSVNMEEVKQTRFCGLHYIVTGQRHHSQLIAFLCPHVLGRSASKACSLVLAVIMDRGIHEAT